MDRLTGHFFQMIDLFDLYCEQQGGHLSQNLRQFQLNQELSEGIVQLVPDE